MPNFEVNNVSVSTLLGFVSDGTIAIIMIRPAFSVVPYFRVPSYNRNNTL